MEALYGAVESTWGDFLRGCKDIVVISTNESVDTGVGMTDMLMSSFYRYQCHSEEHEQISIFMDEIDQQNLSDNGIIYEILRRGRKSNISLNIATQYVTDKKIQSLLNQAKTKVYFKSDNNDKLAKILDLNKKNAAKLNHMKKGCCFISGEFYNFENRCTENTILYGQTLLVEDSPLCVNKD